MARTRYKLQKLSLQRLKATYHTGTGISMQPSFINFSKVAFMRSATKRSRKERNYTAFIYVYEDT